MFLRTLLDMAESSTIVMFRKLVPTFINKDIVRRKSKCQSQSVSYSVKLMELLGIFCK